MVNMADPSHEFFCIVRYYVQGRISHKQYVKKLVNIREESHSFVKIMIDEKLNNLNEV